MKKFMFFTAIMLIMGMKTAYAQDEVKDSILLIPQIYDNVYCNGGNMIIIEKNKKRGVVNSEGKVIVPLKYDDIEVPSRGNDYGNLIIIEENKKKGVVNSEGKEIVPLKYSDIEVPYKGNDCGNLIVVRDGKCGLYNTNGEVVLQCENSNYVGIDIQKDWNGIFSYGFEGLATVRIFERIKIDSLYEMVDKPGGDIDFVFKGVDKKTITKPGILLENGTLNTSYESYEVLRFGFVKVKKDRKVGIINKKGNVIVPVKYDDINLVANRLFKVKSNGTNSKGYGIIDDKGNEIIPIGKYNHLEIDMGECFIVGNNNQKGALSLKGAQIVPMGAYDRLYEEDCEDNINHYIRVYKGDKEGAASLNGKIFVPCGKYEFYKVLDDNLTLVTLNKRKGIINRNGIVVVPIGKYADIEYKYGILYYSQNGKFGLLDKKGKQATLAIYDRIEPLRKFEGTCIVNKGKEIGLLDSQGHNIIPFGELIDGKFYGDVGMFKNNRGTMFFLKNGKILSDYGKYEDAEKKYGKLAVLRLDANVGLFVIESNSKKGVVKLW